MSYTFSWQKYINFHDNEDDNHGCMTRFLPHHLFRLKQIFTTFIPHGINSIEYLFLKRNIMELTCL